MSAPNRDQRRRRDEVGVTLIELVIAMVLTSGVLALAATLFVTGLRGNSEVNSTTQATIQSQGVAQGIERAVRNAQRIKLETCVSTNTNCTKLTIWTNLGGARTCQQWSMSAATNGKIQFAQAATTLGTPTAFGPGTSGATLSFSAPSDVLSAGKIIGVKYVVTYPSATKPVTVSGTVRSRTPYNTASATTCTIAP